MIFHQSFNIDFSGGSNGSDRSQTFELKTPERSNGSARSQVSTSEPFDLIKIQESMKGVKEKFYNRGKSEFIIQFIELYFILNNNK